MVLAVATEGVLPPTMHSWSLNIPTVEERRKMPFARLDGSHPILASESKTVKAKQSLNEDLVLLPFGCYYSFFK